jgi:outer membrane protein insertion porin family
LFWGSAALSQGKAAFAKIRRYGFFLAAVACFAAANFCIASALAQNFVVQRIDIVGNRRIPRDTLRSRIFTREGDAYNEETLRRDFQALWNTQYFEDVRLEVEDSPDRPNSKIVVFYVKERPTIRRIEYKGASSLTESDILDRFKERKVGLTVESQFDPTRIKRAEVVLRELLGEHGRQFAVIKPTYERIPGTNAVKLTFNVEEGPKVKVGKIKFEGNKAFSDRKLIRAMHHSRPYGIPLGITYLDVLSKTYDRRKLDEDLEIGIRGLYQDNGYFQVLVKDPKLDTVDVSRGGLPGPIPLLGHKHGKATNITIPIDEGELYHMGKVVVRSIDPDKPLFFKPEFLQAVFPIKPGEIFSTAKVRKALEDYHKLYGDYGYIDFTPQPATDVDAAHKLINLTLELDEQKQFHVGRIEFVGNTTTRDKVIRREILIDEGDIFNNRLWEISILRLNQLDYFDPIKPEHAELKRNLKEGSVDIVLKVKEKGKQSIGLTGGISGISGTFIGFNYQTNNFLGLGETLTFSSEFGTRQRNFLFGFTEPYFRDKPISTGFTIFDSRYNFNQTRETSLILGRQVNLGDPNATQNYNQDSKGFTMFASYPLKRVAFLRLGATYSYTITDITAFSAASRLLFENVQFRGIAGPSALRGIRSSKITPTLSYNSTDSVLNPTRGKTFFLSLAIEGGPLQGNVNAFTPTFEMKYFHAVNKKRNVLAMRVLSAFATGYSGTVVPPYSRFYMGGEDTIRGFDIRTITPVSFVPQPTTLPVSFTDPTSLDANGNPRVRALNVPVLLYSYSYPGGDLETVGNFEYRIPLVGPVSMDLFVDGGVNGVLRRNQLTLDPTGLANLQQQFPNSTFSSQLQLAPKSNFQPRVSTGIQFVVQLPIVQAPFRIYWAYNAYRYKQLIATPRGDYFLDNADRMMLQQIGVLNSQVIPALNAQLASQSQLLRYAEPLRTIRFTVSRTF